MEAIGSPAAGIAAAPSPRLLERAPELAAIGEALDAAAGGAGACVVLEGPPGLGKTTLLQATRRGDRAPTRTPSWAWGTACR